MAIKYFLYSEEQIREKNNVLVKMYKKFAPGIVVVNNKKEQFTQLSDSLTIPRFVDTKIVATGDPKDFVYRMPENVTIRS